MGPFRKLLLVGVGVLALHGVQACSNETTSLNPQPLPPQGEGTNDPTQSPPADGKSSNSGGDTTNGAGGTPPAPAASPDAGSEGGDAADGGDG